MGFDHDVYVMSFNHSYFNRMGLKTTEGRVESNSLDD